MENVGASRSRERGEFDTQYVGLKIQEKLDQVEYVNSGPPNPEEVGLFEQARDFVATSLEENGSADAAKRVRDIDSRNNIVMFDDAVGTEPGASVSPGFHARSGEDGKLYFTRNIVQAGTFVHIATHELFHFASTHDTKVVHAVDRIYARTSSGFSRRAIVKDWREQEVLLDRFRFIGLNEAMTEMLTRNALPESFLKANNSKYDKYRYLMHSLLRGIVEVHAQDNPPLTLKEVWTRLTKDYISGSFNFLADIEKRFGRGSVQTLSRFGIDRDDDLKIMRQFTQSSGKNFDPSEMERKLRAALH